MSERSQFVVGHWRRVYRISRDHPQPQAQRHKLDSLLDDRLIPALEARLSPLLDQQEGVWLIHSLETSLALDSRQLEESPLAELIGRQIKRRLAQITAAAPDGDNVRYFPSRAAFAAQFIRECMDGTAGDRWEYQAFAGLRSLPLPQTIREAIIRDGAATARGVVGILRQTRRWPALQSLLSDHDAERIWLVCTGDLTSMGKVQPAEIEWLIAHWSEAGERAPRWANAKTMLRLWAARLGSHLTEHPSVEQANAAASIQTWLAFLDLVENAPSGIDFDFLAAGDFRNIPLPQYPAYAAVLPDIAKLGRSGAWLELVTRAVVRPLPAGGLQATPVTFTSPCAGLFLLLRVMLDLELPALLAKHAPSAEAARQWLACIALQCLGGERATQNRRDPAFLLAMGLQDLPHLEPDWPSLDALLPAWREFLRAGRYISGTHLALSPIDGGTVIHDMRLDYWLAVTAHTDTTLAQLAASLEPAQLTWQRGDPAPANEPGATFARYYQPAQADIHYLRLPQLSDKRNWMLMPFSQAILRNFARRQMGFGWSSAAYSDKNFLAGVGQITRWPGRIDVLLPDVPLAAVLRMTGYHRDEYDYPWAETGIVRLLLP